MTRPRNRAAHAAGVALLLVLAGCSSQQHAGRADLPAASGRTASMAPTPSGVVDAAFLAGVRAEFPTRTDADLISMGLATCGVLATGATWLQVLRTVLDEGLSSHAGGELIGASVAAYCPQYKARLP